MRSRRALYSSGCYTYTIECPLSSGEVVNAPGAAVQVVINSATIAINQISTTLRPNGVSGAFSLWESSGSVSNYSQTAITRDSGAYTDGFNLAMSTPAGQYTTIYAAWSVSNVQVVTSYNFSFYNYGNTHHSQYTLINEATCPGGSSTPYIITNLSACFSSGLITTNLNSQFQSQTALNGTGQSNQYNLLKALNASSCSNATQGKPSGANGGNSFVEVSSVTAACGNFLTTSTVAQYGHSCGLQIFISGYGNPGTLKTVQDECPACGNDPPHFDNWNPSGGPSCGLTLPDLGGGYYVTEQVQQ